MINDRMRNLRLVHSQTGLEPSSAGRSPLGSRPGTTERALPPLDPMVRSMLEHVRIIAPLPRMVRARVLARARATLLAAQL